MDTKYFAEIAYRVAGGSWKRKIFKTEAAYDKWFAQMDEKHGMECIEICWAEG